jgi:hypothetical protein
VSSQTCTNLIEIIIQAIRTGAAAPVFHVTIPPHDRPQTAPTKHTSLIQELPVFIDQRQFNCWPALIVTGEGFELELVAALKRNQ